MPHRVWKLCCSDAADLIAGPSICAKCGTLRQLLRWDLSTIERMAQYASRTGFKSTGPHRGYTDERFRGAFEQCAGCDTSGLRDVNNGEGFELCRECEGNGYRAVWSETEMAAARADVLQRFPGAAGEFRMSVHVDRHR